VIGERRKGARRWLGGVFLAWSLLFLPACTPDDDDTTDDDDSAAAESWSGVGVGHSYRCFLAQDGALSCSGFGEFGQTEPPDGEFVAVESGLHHSCALKADGEAVCWGFNGFGGTQVPAGTYSMVDAGGYQSCGVHGDGTLTCWGGIRDGEADVPPGQYKHVSGGEGHTCAITDIDVVRCWGLDFSGQASPPDVLMKEVSGGWDHSCGLGLDGQAYCWGEDSSGESSPPEGVFVSIGAGMHYSCGVRASGDVECWGIELNDITEAPKGHFVKVVTGSQTACGLTDDQQVMCWGAEPTKSGPHPDSGEGFTVSGVAWDIGKFDWAAEGLCLSAVDPLAFWLDQPLTPLSSSTIAGAGAFTLPNIQTSSSVGVFFYTEDCNGLDNIVPTTAGILAEEYQGLEAGAQIGNAFALAFDRDYVQSLDESIALLGDSGISIEERGAIFVVITTDTWEFVGDAVIRCPGGVECADVFYLDADPSDGHFGSGSLANTQSTGAMDMGVFIIGSPLTEFDIEHPTMTFPSLSMASRPGTITAMRFTAE